VGIAASYGDGKPATSLPIDTPSGLACDALGNLFITSRTTVRMLPANDNRVVDGCGPVFTIYGTYPRDGFPQSVTACLTGIAAADEATVEFTDSCTGFLVALHRVHVAP